MAKELRVGVGAEIDSRDRSGVTDYCYRVLVLHHDRNAPDLATKLQKRLKDAGIQSFRMDLDDKMGRSAEILFMIRCGATLVSCEECLARMPVITDEFGVQIAKQIGGKGCLERTLMNEERTRRRHRKNKAK